MSPAPGLIRRAWHGLVCWIFEGPCTRGGEWAPLAGEHDRHNMPVPAVRVVKPAALPLRRVTRVGIKRATPIARLRPLPGGRRWHSR